MSIEIDIANELRRLKSPVAAATRLLENVDIDLLDKHELMVLAQFALNAGAYEPLVNNFAQWFRKSPLVPWPQFLEFLNRLGVKANKELRKNVLEGAKRQEALELLALSRSWDKIEPRIPKIRINEMDRLIKKHRDRHSALKEKMHFVRSQRLIEEEEKVLGQLAHEYPKDEEIARERLDFKERWARDVVARTKAGAVNDNIDLLPTPASPAELTIAETWSQILIERGRSQARESYNYVMFFYFMDLHHLALQHARSAPSSQELNWLTADLLYVSGRYIEALDHLQRIESQYQDDPDALFAANYLRALCYWKLRKHSSAIEILQSIVAVRPDYRAARAFLADWNGGHR